MQKSIRALIGDYQNPNRICYKLAHAFFTEGKNGSVMRGNVSVWIALP